MVNHKPKRIPKSEQEMFNSFLEQVNFLVTAAAAYDNGNRSAIKMATPALRTLFYKQSFGPILIDQISTIDKSKFISTVEYSSNSIIYMGPVTPTSLQNPLSNEEVYVYLPNCYDSAMKASHVITFDQWWNGNIFINQNDFFTRRDLIRLIANQDGGSHVDNRLEAKYSKMVHNAMSFIAGPANKPFEELNLALIRQIVHETMLSFKKMNLTKIIYDSGENSFNNTHQINPFGLTHFSFSTGTSQETLFY
jgi:hypothetical protein